MKLNMENSLIAEHPSVSRHHAVLQYKHFSENSDEKESTPESGWFIYDLGEINRLFHQLIVSTYINIFFVYLQIQHTARLSTKIEQSRELMFECVWDIK